MLVHTSVLSDAFGAVRKKKMSTAESEQDKQPFSAINDAVPSGKDELGDPPTEVTKSTFETETKPVDSTVTEAESAKNGDEEKTETEAHNPEVVINGDLSKSHENVSSLTNESNETNQKSTQIKEVVNGVETGDENCTTKDVKNEGKPAETTELDKGQEKVENVPVKVEDAVPESKREEEAGVKESVEQNENQPSEESTVAVTGKSLC